MAFIFELGLILLFSILGGVLAVRFRQPSVLGLLIVGAIVGPNLLGFIKSTSLINASVEIGAILLLFTVGIEFSLQRLLNLGLRTAVVAVIKLGAVFLFSYYTALLFQFDFIAALYIGVILSITSTVIVIKVLDQKGMSKRGELPLLVAVLVIEDLFGVFALTFFSGLNAKADLVPLNLFTSLLVSLTIMAIAYVILQRALKPIINWLVKYSTEDTITFLSLGLCGGMSYLASIFGLSPSVGAFLAGNIVASLPNSKIFQKAIHPFILTFTSLFFFSIGTIVDFSYVLNSAYLVLALFVVNIVSKFFSIGFGSYMFAGFSGKQAVFGGIAMASVGEFSLLIANESEKVGIGIDLVSITASIIVLSTIAMSVMLNKTDKIYNLTLRIIPSKIRDDMSSCCKYADTISFEMVKDKISAEKIGLEWRKIFNNVVAILLIVTIIFFLWSNFSALAVTILKSKLVAYSISSLFLLAIFFPALNIARNTSKLIRDLLSFFIRLYPNEIANERKIFRNVVFLIALFVVAALFPGIFVLLGLKPIHHLIVLFLLIAVFWYLFRSSELIYNFTKRHEVTFNKLSRKYRALVKKKMKPAEMEQ